MNPLASQSGLDRLAGPRNEQVPALPRRKGRSEVRRGWWWRRGKFSLEDVLSDVALPVVDVPVGVADVVVPNHWIHTEIAGLHRRIPWAPTTWAGWVVFRTSGPTS
jgi:hypothetical protein